jgi:hypothetical protein
MGVQVDQAGADDKARHVADIGAVTRLQVRPDLRDLAGGEGDVGDAVEVLRRVDDAPALEDEIVGHFRPVLR